MESIPLEHGLMLAATLFCLGLVGVMTRRNIVFVLMSLEIMLNASGLAFIVAGARWGSAAHIHTFAFRTEAKEAQAFRF